MSAATRIAPWLLMAVALVLRLYRLADYTVFQGDQGIDALAARRLVVEHVWPLEGPATSAGGVHLGPLYYYVLALPMLLGSFDPVHQAALVAVLGAAAVGLLYWLAFEWFGFWPAVIAAGLFAVAPAAIVATRSAWNPAPAPFFLLLALLALARCHRTCDGRWLLLTGVGLGALIQFHYFTVGVVLVGVGGIVYEAFRIRRSGAAWALLSLLALVALLSPLLVHEVRDGFPNVQAARALAVEAPAQPSERAPRRLYEVLALGLVGGFLTAGFEAVAVLLSLVLLVGLAVRRGYGQALIVLALLASALQALAYRGPIF
ncbi:MAG TPA: glycosyltransferase family 39 protein, partial [Chloroflexota bacterium]|nr:glycosyltransferase family 39 protein [Chloroflexota bacterium]